MKPKSRVQETITLDFAATMAALEDAYFLYGTQSKIDQWTTTEHTARYLRGIVPLARLRAKRAKRRRK